jgi:hypothetical protein
VRMEFCCLRLRHKTFATTTSPRLRTSQADGSGASIPEQTTITTLLYSLTHLSITILRSTATAEVSLCMTTTSIVPTNQHSQPRACHHLPARPRRQLVSTT